MVKDLGDGTYNMTYTVNTAGTYQLFVGLAFGDMYEEALPGSPFTVVSNLYAYSTSMRFEYTYNLNVAIS